jgi:hypothetical protein
LGDVENIALAYLAVLVTRKSRPADASELPYPKATIKSALIVAIALTEDVQTRERLRSAFAQLADWQEGIGPGPHMLDVADRPGEDIRANAKRIAEDAPAYLALSKRVTAEMEQLIAELKALGL